MSTIETILTLAIINADFAEKLFTDTEKVIAGYDLSAEEIAEIKSMPRAVFLTLPK